MTTKKTKAFVYGSLLSGLGNHDVLNGSKRIARDVRTAPLFTMHAYCGGFPAVVGNGEHAIRGEVYEVDSDTLQRLDRLEGHPRFYRRTMTVIDGIGECWIYLLARCDAEVIENGDWRSYHEGN